MGEPSKKEPVSLPTPRGGLRQVTQGQANNEPNTAEKTAAPKAPTGPTAPSKRADSEAADARVDTGSGCSYYTTAPTNDVTSPKAKGADANVAKSQKASEAKNIASGTAEPRVGKIASVTQSASKETCGPTKSTASVATGGGTATATTSHPATAKPSKTESVLPGTSQSPQNAASSASPKTQSAAQRRLNEELADLVRDPPPGCSAYPANRDYPFKWRAVIAGPKNTPFEGGTFSMDVTFPRDYPNHPPKIKFTTKIYHPNVSEDGDIGLDIIRSKWSPGVTVESVLLAIVDLMKTPDMNCVLHRKAAQHYKEDYQLYDTIAREWTQTFAEPDEEDPGVWPPVI